MKKKMLLELNAWGITPLPFWNGELQYVFEHRYENRYFREFFLHICNYMDAEQIIGLFKKDETLRMLMFNNYGDIFNIREKKIVTDFTYKMANAVMEMCGCVDDELLKTGEFYYDCVPDKLERLYLNWVLWKN